MTAQEESSPIVDTTVQEGSSTIVETTAQEESSAIVETTTSMFSPSDGHRLTSNIETTVMSTNNAGTTSIAKHSTGNTWLSTNVYSNSTTAGLLANLTNTPCDTLQPCQNDGTCNHTNTIADGYICLCRPGFHGTQCQFDYRSCRPDTCWNDGKPSHFHFI